ncbi:hypothetical protein PR202_gb12428 [Eleusine coracana subsp. coracana]|uniref:Bifunctional inhibitor/plant lipid transfer protein/seed storage helical domain-containing protein n=1 Tax=Eleusine coracana subsp. coracana TaxID=191504 RepID=A0AAV5EMS5_ELECO|nr:hypothetical protein QOZ80_7BG0588620 [Eleusine coracana subsp. coracana]GJN24674.1 hypothetical protein PR202_gb12428 [Eleusine coracana subsp. coracana]
MARLLVVHKLLALAVVVTALMAAPAAGQPGGTAVSCTASLVTSFAPCLNFITNNSASPTADCCRSLGALVNVSANCACLILTGSVPLGVPVNRSLAVTMPRACNTSAVPLQCQDPTTAALTPAPGPVAEVAPSLAPLPPVTPTTPVPEAPEPAPPVVPTATPPASQGETRPAVLPSSAWRKSSDVSATAAFVLLLAVGGALV